MSMDIEQHVSKATQINKIMSKVPLELRYYWCEAEMCNCFGCANRAGGVEAQGIIKREWEIWVKNNPLTVVITKE